MEGRIGQMSKLGLIMYILGIIYVPHVVQLHMSFVTQPDNSKHVSRLYAISSINNTVM